MYAVLIGAAMTYQIVAISTRKLFQDFTNTSAITLSFLTFWVKVCWKDIITHYLNKEDFFCYCRTTATIATLSICYGSKN